MLFYGHSTRCVFAQYNQKIIIQHNICLKNISTATCFGYTKSCHRAARKKITGDDMQLRNVVRDVQL